MATMIDASGKVRRFEDIDKIKWVDRNGEVLFETDYGDTVTYEQGGEVKTKKLTETRRLLQFMDGFAAGDYSYMPTKIGDVFQGISLEMMTDSALYTVGKGAAVLTFGAAGGLVGGAVGAGLGASFGAWLANAGMDIYKFAQAYNEEPNTFWNRYVSSLKDIARGADSNLEPNATGWRRVLSEINVGTSYIGMGGKAAVYETWDDIVGTPEIGYVAANIFGNVTRAICAGVGGTMSYVVDQGLNDALREGTRIVGITNDIALAAEVGAIYGLVAGGTAWGFNKLNLANKLGLEKLEKVSPFLGNPLANGIDATSAQLLYDFIQDRIDPTEAPKDISDYGLNAAMALVTGWSMSALPVMWSKIKPKQLADATKNIDAPKPSDTPTVKEAVESKVIVEEAIPDSKTTKQKTVEADKEVTKAEPPKPIRLVEPPEHTEPKLERGELKPYTEAQLIDLQNRMTLREYREQTNVAEKELLRSIIPDDKKINEKFNKMKDIATDDVFAGLSEEQKKGFLSRLGFVGETAQEDFKNSTPLSDLLIWGELNKTDVFDIPVYNPNMPALSVQQNTDIVQGALKLINMGGTIETAIFQSYCQRTKVAPDANEIARFVNQLPQSVKVFRNDYLPERVAEFMRTNLEKPQKTAKLKAEPKPKKVGVSDMQKLFNSKAIVKDNVFISENGKFSMINDKNFADFSDKVKAKQTEAVSGTVDRLVETTQKEFRSAIENRQNNVEVVKEGDIFGRNEYTNLKIDGKPKYVLQKWWDFAKKMIGKDFDVWTAKGEPNKIYFSKGGKTCYIELETARSKFNEKK